MAGEHDAFDVRALEETALGAPLRFTRVEVADKAGVSLDVAEELWQQLGFPHAGDDDVAFTEEDVEALSRTRELVELGVLTPDSQAALVRTWGRSFARLAEWQVALLTRIAVEAEDPASTVDELTGQVLPAVEHLQSYVWRRHLAGAVGRLLEQGGDTSTTLAVGFVDIVGFTGRSRQLTEGELVAWVEHFEEHLTRSVVEAGGRVIKTIGDEVLFVTDTPAAAAEVALIATERGADPEDEFPQVRAGIAYGGVVSRLGDVLGPTVNVAARLTSIARPGTVLVDRGAHEALLAVEAADDPAPTEGEPSKLAALVDRAAEELADLAPYSEGSGFSFRRVPRTSVKGYKRLEAWAVRRPS
ncbi:adenylate/guanylate cyclase domain-containing protein [Nocardioides bigeumensis]|uniref:Adenylate/guanylate cyclase domain-containing protein n=1 Tax=Nocardioides bigeumensis TaxID=433657 RepID=A0ABN2YV46_9ACTN